MPLSLHLRQSVDIFRRRTKKKIRKKSEQDRNKMSESEDKNYSDTEVERSPLARFRSEAMKYQHTISAGTASTFRLPVVIFDEI